MHGFEQLEHALGALERQLELDELQRGVLDAVSEFALKAAKAMPGTYQDGVGGIPDWPALAARTVKDKERLKFAPPDNPLLRTGDMRDSLDRTVLKDEACVGSNSDVMVAQELGTSKVPPRSVLALAGAITTEHLDALCGPEVAKALAISLR